MENKDYKIYSMLLEIRETFFLSIQYATSLEQAFNQAKLEFLRINPPVSGVDNSLLGSKIGLFTIKNIDQLIHENKVYDDRQLQKIALRHHKIEKKEEKKEIKKPVEIKKVQLSQDDVKNMIMKEIITKKDKKILEEHKQLFNDNEIQYLTDKIEGKIK